MMLFNTTLAAARLDTTVIETVPERVGLLTVKATFRFDANGCVALDAEAPLPLSNSDIETPLGLLPGELEPRNDQRLEVILLGHAHAPAGRPVSVLSVVLSVGDIRREIRVSGDRVWQGAPGARSISQPEPFVRMPLTYARAFGGSAGVLLDEKTEFVLRDAYNPRGLGFDPEPQLAGLAQLLRPPAGYPRLLEATRRLPNLEHPGRLIARWEDAPEPCCWATQPFDVSVALYREVQKRSTSPGGSAASLSEYKPPTEAPPLGATCLRAHPDWVIPVPSVAAKLRLENLVEGYPVLQLTLPDHCFIGDYTIQGREGSRKLTPQTLVLLPDERRFYILYRLPFTYPFTPGDDRAFRLRMAPGWSAGEPD